MNKYQQWQELLEHKQHLMKKFPQSLKEEIESGIFRCKPGDLLWPTYTKQYKEIYNMFHVFEQELKYER